MYSLTQKVDFIFQLKFHYLLKFLSLSHVFFDVEIAEKNEHEAALYYKRKVPQSQVAAVDEERNGVVNNENQELNLKLQQCYRGIKKTKHLLYQLDLRDELFPKFSHVQVERCRQIVTVHDDVNIHVTDAHDHAMPSPRAEPHVAVSDDHHSSVVVTVQEGDLI